MSKVMDRVSNKFPVMASKASMASKKFQEIKAKTDGYTRSLNRAGKKMQGIGRTAQVGLSLPIGLAGGAMVNAAVEFDKSMNRVGALTQTIVKGQVTPQFEALENKAMELGKSTAFSAKEVGDAMGFLAQAGFDTNEIMTTIGPTLQLAAASNTDLARTADIASNILGAFGKDASELGNVADILALTTAKTNVDMEQLADTMKFTAPIAKTYGASLEETAALTGLLGNVGLQGTVAGTALKKVFLNLASPASTAAKELNALGVATTNADGSMRKVTDVFADLGPKLSRLPKNDQIRVLKDVFGARGIAGAAELMTQAMNKRGGGAINAIEKMTQVLENGEGAAKDMSDALLRGSVGVKVRFQSALNGLAISFTKEGGLLDAFTQVLNKGIKFIEFINTLSPATKKIITIFAGFLFVLGPILFVVGKLVSLFGYMIPAFGFLYAGVLKVIPIIALLGKTLFVALAPMLVIAAKLALIGLALWSAFKVGVVLGKLLVDIFTRPQKALDNFIANFKNQFGSIKKFFSFGGLFGGDKAQVEATRNVNVNQTGQALATNQALAQKENRDFITRTNNARVDVAIKAPEQTPLVVESQGGPFLNVETGLLGGF